MNVNSLMSSDSSLIDPRSVSPVGDEASKLASVKIAEGFNLGYLKAKPGNGPLMHNHDTNETFIPMTGRWRCAWNEGDAYQFVDLGPLDVITFPAGPSRCVTNITENDAGTEHTILFVIAGDNPAAAFTVESKAFATSELHGRDKDAAVSQDLEQKVIA